MPPARLAVLGGAKNSRWKRDEEEGGLDQKPLIKPNPDRAALGDPGPGSPW